MSVSIGRDATGTVVTVVDNGIGMTKEECSRIYDEFYRVKNKYTEKITGTGLGLNIVKQLVDRHDGTIVVSSNPHKGTTFIVSIPIAP